VRCWRRGLDQLDQAVVRVRSGASQLQRLDYLEQLFELKRPVVCEQFRQLRLGSLKLQLRLEVRSERLVWNVFHVALNSFSAVFSNGANYIQSLRDGSMVPCGESGQQRLSRLASQWSFATNRHDSTLR